MIMPHGDNRWIQTYTGKRFWPLDPSAEDVCLEDIAHALSMRCRFGGHCLRFYSVAQHCVEGAAALLNEGKQYGAAAVGMYANTARAFLLHDADEAYAPHGDVPRPIKTDADREVSERLLEAVFEHFGLRCLDWHIANVHLMDAVMLSTEHRDMMRPGLVWGADETAPLPQRLEAQAPATAFSRFMELAADLGIKD